MPKLSNRSFLIVLGIIAISSDFMFVVALRDYQVHGAVFTGCRISAGCGTSLWNLVAFGAAGLIATLLFLLTVIGIRQKW
jgi:hypothetical protein